MAFDFTDMIMSSAGRFTVGFVRNGEYSVASMGSGTLVTFGSVGGILTCAHVLQEVLTLDEIGIVCFPVRPTETQRWKIGREKTSHVMFGAPPWSQTGPDIGFLRLPSVFMTELGSVASIVNIEKHRTDAISSEPDPQHCFEVVSGVIGDWTGDAIQTGSMAKTTFEALLNVGRVVDKSEARSFDLYRFEPVPAEEFKLPENYRGTSGGGLWRLYTKKEIDGSFSLIQRRLVGVAFWETPGERHIICHGQSSIYNRLFEKIRTTRQEG